MIVANAKSAKASSSSSPLSLSTPKDKPILSFSDLLRGAGDKKDEKLIQNGSLVLALESEEKSLKTTKSTPSKRDSLLSLLKNEENLAPNKSVESLELNPKLTAALSTADIKTLVSDAKIYLKSKIQESEGYKKAELKELPNTLKGLVEVAKKFNIDISKITFEEVRSSSKNISQILGQEEIKAEASKEALQEKKELKTEMPKETLQEKKELKTEMPKTEIPREVVSEKKELKSEMPKTETPREVVSEKKELKTEMPKEATPRSEIVSKEIPKELRELSIFKTQAVVQHTTTEQILQAKANNITQKIEQKVPKERADETLMLLLRGEKPSGENALFTADFSVATAKIIAPSVTQEGIKTLEQLLNADSLSSEQNGSSVKTEPLTTHKADSFEVKLNEAKQMIKYLSNDVKNAIDDYRSPFTRVKVQLNPQNLGEVDLTVVQRGKNLHVNISSNNAAINTLSMNINELRVQLNNSGINSATFNFSSGSQSGDTNAGGQHQQRQNERQAHEEYGYFEAEEAAEEILSSLEIIVPRYI